MNFGDIIGQVFRDSTGMSTKVTSYNNKLKIYDEISRDISAIEDSSIDYFDAFNYLDWKYNEAKRIKLNSDVARGIVSSSDYVLLLSDLDVERRIILDDFISSTDLYFVIAYRNRLYSIKKRNNKDNYISLMKFDTWIDMEEARELANLAALQIRSSDKYIDAKRIAEIRDKYMREKHLRRGR